MHERSTLPRLNPQPAGQASHLKERIPGFGETPPSFYPSVLPPHPSPLCPQPVHGERKAFAWCDSDPPILLRENIPNTVKTVNKENPPTLSNPNMVVMWQLKATRPSSQSSRMSASTSLDQACPMTSIDQHSLLCS